MKKKAAKRTKESPKIRIGPGDVLSAWAVFRDEWLYEQEIPKEHRHVVEWVDMLIEWAESYSSNDTADQIESLASDIQSMCCDISDTFSEQVDPP